MDSKINPDHYKIGGIETIDYIEAKLTKEQFRGYLVGNVIKYISALNIKTAWKILKGRLVFKSVNRKILKIFINVLCMLEGRFKYHHSNYDGREANEGVNSGG